MVALERWSTRWAGSSIFATAWLALVEKWRPQVVLGRSQQHRRTQYRSAEPGRSAGAPLPHQRQNQSPAHRKRWRWLSNAKTSPSSTILSCKGELADYTFERLSRWRLPLTARPPAPTMTPSSPAPWPGTAPASRGRTSRLRLMMDHAHIVAGLRASIRSPRVYEGVLGGKKILCDTSVYSVSEKTLGALNVLGVLGGKIPRAAGQNMGYRRHKPRYTYTVSTTLQGIFRGFSGTFRDVSGNFAGDSQARVDTSGRPLGSSLQFCGIVGGAA